MERRLGVPLMAKIRGIKPEFWTDEDIVELSIPARLLFIGMWNHACDNGHLDDKPRQIKMRILPGDDVNIGKLLDELVERGRIERKDGTITIPKFAHHQKPHSRWWTVCDLPECTPPGTSTTVAKPSRKGVNNGGATVGHGGSRETTAVLDVDGDGDGELKVATTTAAKRGTQLPKTWAPSDAHRRLAAERSVNVDEEADKFRDWCAANGATKKDWEATFRNWIRNARPTPGNVTPIRPDADGRVTLPPLPPKGFFDR